MNVLFRTMPQIERKRFWRTHYQSEREYPENEKLNMKEPSSMKNALQ